MQQIILVIGLYVIVMGIVYLYKYSTAKKDELKAFYKKKLIRGGVVGAIVVIVLLAQLMFSRMIGVGMGGMVPVPNMATRTSSSGSSMYIPYVNYNNNGNISDTREYNKKTFSANIKTRAVEEIAKKVEGLIKMLDGRIDSSNISESNASFSFVIPKTKLDSFESQMRSFASKKLYSQTVTSQNLLNEKQNLEQNQTATQESINYLAKQKTQVEADYTKKINTLKSQITAKRAQLELVNSSLITKESSLAAATDSNVIQSISSEVTSLEQSKRIYTQDITRLTSEINAATNVFKSQMSGLGMSLDNQNQVLSNLGTQETQFLDKVETVQGSVSISYITLWELLNIFSPFNLWVVLGILILIGRLLLLRKEENSLK